MDKVAAYVNALRSAMSAMECAKDLLPNDEWGFKPNNAQRAATQTLTEAINLVENLKGDCQVVTQ